MTDHEYTSKIYCSVFNTTDDGGDTYTRGVLDMLGTLSNREQDALDCYFRHGNTFKQIGVVLDGITGESARRIVHKALSKLRHPSRIKKISVKRLLEDREQKLAVAGIEIDELYEQIDALTLNSPINPKIRYKVDFRKKSISEIGFSSRVYNHLLNAGISTIESLLTLDSLDILAQRRSFGKASKLEIVQKMRQNEYVEWADKMDGYAPLAK